MNRRVVLEDAEVKLYLSVLPSSGADVILEKGVKKHANHDKNENTQYVLLYPDCTQVINLPGTNEPFDLKKYREDIGKSYQRITLFIAKKTDKIFAELHTIDSVIVKMIVMLN